EPAPTAPPRSARGPPTLAYVRIVKSGRPLEVGSETVELREDDILSLPAETARLLVEAKVAEAVAPVPNRSVT
ncbi:MAG: hypothetical protein ACREDE_04135, partial [Thermoplasmata archaeon]